jgi:hypothetical protein
MNSVEIEKKLEQLTQYANEIAKQPNPDMKYMLKEAFEFGYDCGQEATKTLVINNLFNSTNYINKFK